VQWRPVVDASDGVHQLVISEAHNNMQAGREGSVLNTSAAKVILLYQLSCDRAHWLSSCTLMTHGEAQGGGGGACASPNPLCQ
jgi:hypothetical protein